MSRLDDLVNINCLLLQIVLQNWENLWKNGNVFVELSLFWRQNLWIQSFLYAKND